MKALFLRFFFLSTAFFFLNTQAYASNNPKLPVLEDYLKNTQYIDGSNFTQEEINVIESFKNKQAKLGMINKNDYITKKGEQSIGYAMPIIDVFKNTFKIDIAPVFFETQQQALDALVNNQIDFIFENDTFTTTQSNILMSNYLMRENIYLLSNSKMAIVDGKIFDTYTLQNSQIGTISDIEITNLCKSYYNIDVREQKYTTLEEGYTALQNNEINYLAIPENQVTNTYQYEGLQVIKMPNIQRATSSILTSGENAGLINGINRYLHNGLGNYLTDSNKYQTFLLQKDIFSTTQILTQEELDYLAQLKQIEVKVVQYEYPLIYLEEGETKGIISDYLNRFAYLIDKPIVYLDASKEEVQPLKDNQVYARYFDESKKDALNLVDLGSIFSNATVMFGLNENKNISTIFKDDPVGIVKESFAYQYIYNNDIDIYDLIIYEDFKELKDALLKAEIKYAIGPETFYYDFIRENNMRVQIIYNFNSYEKPSLITFNKDSKLKSIYEKSISFLSDDQEMDNKWYNYMYMQILEQSKRIAQESNASILFVNIIGITLIFMSSFCVVLVLSFNRYKSLKQSIQREQNDLLELSNGLSASIIKFIHQKNELGESAYDVTYVSPNIDVFFKVEIQVGSDLLHFLENLEETYENFTYSKIVNGVNENVQFSFDVPVPIKLLSDSNVGNDILEEAHQERAEYCWYQLNFNPYKINSNNSVTWSCFVVNINDSKRNQILLKQKEEEISLEKERVYAILKTSKVVSYNISKDKNGEEILRIFDISHIISDEDVKELSIVDLHFYIHPDDLDTYLKGREKVKNGKETTFLMEYRIKIPNVDGYKWFRDHCVIEYKEDGKQSVMGTLVDISSMVEMNNQLYHKNMMFDMLVSNIRDVFIIVNLKIDIIEYISPNYFELCSYFSNIKIEDMTMDIIKACIHPDDLDIFKNTYHNAIAGMKNEAEFRIIALDGVVLWVHVGMYPVLDTDGSIIYLVLSFNEITHSKWLLTSNNRMASLVNSNTQSVIISSLDARITYMNAKAFSMLGYTSDEVINKSASTIHTEESEEQNQSVFGEIMAGGITIISELKRKDGSVFPAEQTIFPIKDSEDNVIEIAAIAVDITDRLKSQNSLKEALDKANIATQAKSDFLSRMSHEIRTPLNAIIGMTQIGLRSVSNPKKVDDYLRKIDKSSKHLLNIINDILDMSKIEAGKLSVRNERFELVGAIQQVVNLVNPKVEEKYQVFKVEMKNIPDNFVVIGDDLRLNQILLNLLSNSVKFTPEEGAIILSIEIKEQIEHKILLEFTVKDTGIGMNQEALDKLFSAFEQADNSISRRFGGTGLGLSICKNLIELMQGNIMVESEPDNGTTFTVTLPFEIVEMLNISTSKIKANLNVLIIDSNKEFCEEIENFLQGMGVNCTTATSAYKAIEETSYAMQNNAHFNIVFVDLKMPEMHGLKIASLLRQYINNDIDIILTNVEDPMEHKEKMDKLGISFALPCGILTADIYNMIMSIAATKQIILPLSEEQVVNDNYNYNGLRFLLVDDANINREIVIELLSTTGVQIDTATNGLEAVEKFYSSAQGYYDIIFMDIQMPIMDGFIASKTIRESTHPDAQSIYIIAMTANVFKEDIDAAMAAGMNLHIGKPIEIPLLHAAIENYMKEHSNKILKSQIENSVILEPEITHQEEVMNTLMSSEYIDFEGGLKRLMGKKKLYIKLLVDFIKFENVIILLNALREKDVETIKREAHTLKGLSSNLGVSKLALICSRIETDLKEGFSIEYDMLADEIQEITDKSKELVEEYANETI